MTAAFANPLGEIPEPIDDHPGPPALLEQSEDMARLANAFRNLSLLESEILKRRYGLGGSPVQSAREIRRALGLPLVAIEEIGVSGLSKLRAVISSTPYAEII